MREMKDSRIEWIGQIPSNWKIERMQWHLEEKNVGNNPVQTTNILSLTNKRGVIPYEEKGNQGNKSKEDVSGYKLAYPNTIVANSMNVIIGSVGLSKYYGCVSPVYYVFQATNNANIEFFNYIFSVVGFQRELRKYANGILEIRLRVSADNILKRPVAIPPDDEQARIVDFLNTKCSEIDAISADIQKEIEILEQYKRSVITEAVTKGLNLDAEMKDSGIEWVGNIPVHWDVRPLYYYFAERKKKNYLGQEQNLLSLSYGKVIRKDINTSEGLLPDSFNGYNIIEPGDIVLRLTDLQNDKRSLRTGLVKEHGIITSAYVTLKAAKEVVPEYFHYLLHAYDVMKVLYNMGNGVRQGLNYSELSKMHIVAPPIDEQKNIAAYLDAKCKEIESIIESKKQQLTVIDSYKKSLIYEYVTGKKEVI